MKKIINIIKKLWYLLLYGRITYTVMDDINGMVCEEKYVDRYGNIVGYWAYGNFDPNLPYQGQSYFTIKR